jgi:hypothetical protein
MRRLVVPAMGSAMAKPNEMTSRTMILSEKRKAGYIGRDIVRGELVAD